MRTINSFQKLAAYTGLMLRQRAAFTLVELMVVITIIAVLAALIIPTVAKVVEKSKIMRARNEMSEIVEAVHHYQNEYNERFPVSDSADNPTIGGALIGKHDFTYGTINEARTGTLTDRFHQPLLMISNTIEAGSGLAPFDYKANNSEVMAILLDQQHFHTPGGAQTVNFQHVLNTRMKNFSRASQVPGVALPGVGDDLVYRDPWGNPYIVTLDLNRDGKCMDALYRMAHVTEQLGTNSDSSDGLMGLSRHPPPYLFPPVSHPGDRHDFQVNDTVIVWSFGPDGRANYNWLNLPEQKADAGDNKDNILSWRLK